MRPPPEFVVALELGLALAGAVLLWRFALSPRARAARPPSPLPAWDITTSDFFAFLLCVIAGSFLAGFGSSAAVKALGLRGDAVTVANGAAAQLGMLAGAVGYLFFHDRGIAAAPVRARRIVLSGVVTFLLALPVLIAVAKLWELLLEATGLPVDKQDLIGMFANAESPWLVAVMFALAVVIAPLGEELVFRAGLFRFLRTRLPRPLALVLPALFFASLHVNWNTLQGLSSLAPLTMLAVIFSLAYERTGHIGTSITAHALFNLNTIALIFSGVGL
jgi:membrane protease YdiL (CAAX protease family)